jgi:hypothetical protein
MAPSEKANMTTGNVRKTARQCDGGWPSTGTDNLDVSQHDLSKGHRIVLRPHSIHALALRSIKHSAASRSICTLQLK